MACLESTDQLPQLLGFHTPAMVADLVRVNVAIIRRWHRRGLIRAACEIHKLPYFDFAQVAVARELAELVRSGISPTRLEMQLGQWSARSAESQPASRFIVALRGKRLLMRRDESLIGADGQCWFEFACGDKPGIAHAAKEGVDGEAVLPFANGDDVVNLASPETLLDMAEELEDSGELAGAIDLYRAAMAAAGPNPDACFALAEALYRTGDLAAARERYYIVLELDEKYVEARANLGCLLAEMGELDMAAAALEGALRHHPDYADAHFHLARTLADLGRHSEADNHWRAYLRLAPNSPWAAEAGSRLSGTHE
jgi:tetratricopeptide (TPR) repeat protein